MALSTRTELVNRANYRPHHGGHHPGKPGLYKFANRVVVPAGTLLTGPRTAPPRLIAYR